jgi:hypothetical protein
MPFDATRDRKSFQLVSRIGGHAPLATHWSYWSQDCRHLVDVFVCLTPNDTKVMDVNAIQAESATVNPPANHTIGPVGDLTGERGVTIVTAYDADLGQSGRECRPHTPPRPSSERALVGSWTIADTASNAASGSDALGIATDAFPDKFQLAGGLSIMTFSPETLTSSEVILMGVQTASGAGAFRDLEPGPISAPMPDGAHVCCDADFVDNLEVSVSLPNVCFACVGFYPVSAEQAEPDEVPLIPPTTSVTTSGVLELTNCTTAADDGQSAPLGEDRPQALFAFHLQAAGPFGAAVSGKYPR